MASGVATWLSEVRTNRTARDAMSRGCDGAPRAGSERMCEFTSLERCAAYVAARAALTAVQRVSGAWPADLAGHTERAALDTVNVTAVAITHDPGSADRRSCLRDAITRALHVAGFIEAAGAMGFGAARLDDVQRL